MKEEPDLLRQSSVQPCSELLARFAGGRGLQPGRRLDFEGVGNRDVYNISAPFAEGGELILAGRVEDRSTEFSQVVFFRREDGVWKPHPDYPVYELQDPFFTRIGGELIFGGVALIRDAADPERIASWVTKFYRGRRVSELNPFLTGPEHMKDIRLAELAGGGIGVLTRPQGARGGRGKIGFFKAPALEDVTAERIAEAPVFEDQFLAEEWGGANEPHLLSNGWIGVLGHIASFDDGGNRHYYAMTFALHPDTREKTPMKMIAARSCFPEGPAKRADLVDVIFSGGLVRQEGGRAVLYVGASDAEAYYLEMEDPFLEYERL